MFASTIAWWARGIERRARWGGGGGVGGQSRGRRGRAIGSDAAGGGDGIEAAGSDTALFPPSDLRDARASPLGFPGCRVVAIPKVRRVDRRDGARAGSRGAAEALEGGDGSDADRGRERSGGARARTSKGLMAPPFSTSAAARATSALARRGLLTTLFLVAPRRARRGAPGASEADDARARDMVRRGRRTGAVSARGRARGPSARRAESSARTTTRQRCRGIRNPGNIPAFPSRDVYLALKMRAEVVRTNVRTSGSHV